MWPFTTTQKPSHVELFTIERAVEEAARKIQRYERWRAITHFLEQLLDALPIIVAIICILLTMYLLWKGREIEAAIWFVAAGVWSVLAELVRQR